jgi:hypothetical protein
VIKTAILLGFVTLALPTASGYAAVERERLDNESRQFETAPLMQWDEPELFAQQQPATVTPTPPPVVPPPASQVQPVPLPIQPTTPPVVPGPVVPDAAVPDTVPLPGDTVDPADPNAGPADGASEEDLSLGDVPNVETIELTPDTAKKALDTYLLVRDKYKDAELENYDNLQDFVDQAPQGKAFEADVKAAGFPNVTVWNTTVTTLSFAYDNSINDQTADTRQQIAELEKDTETAKDMRDRMIKALNAMIPSDNNKKVLEAMKTDPVYAEKLKILETETE